MFKEITEEGSSHKKNRLSFVFLTRIFIRYVTRFTGYKMSYFLLCLINYLFFLISRSNNYNLIQYIIQINIYRNKCLYYASKSQYDNQTNEKKKWAKFILEHSKDKTAINNAKDYIDLVYNYKDYKPKYTSIPKLDNQKFYFPGPNTNKLSQLSDAVVVLSKPTSESIVSFKGSILFLNSHYYRNNVIDNTDLQSKLIEKYDEIYVSCTYSKLAKGFTRISPMHDFDSGYLSGPMALGRMLNTLKKTYKNISLVIEGYDFYLNSSPYNSNYITSTRSENGSYDEKEICWSLFSHDALYNFLYVKKLSENILIEGSSSFKEIINLSGSEYLEKLFKVRHFRKI